MRRPRLRLLMVRRGVVVRLVRWTCQVALQSPRLPLISYHSASDEAKEKEARRHPDTAAFA